MLFLLMILKMCLKNICRISQNIYKLITMGWDELKHLNTTQQIQCDEINRFSKKLGEVINKLEEVNYELRRKD